jgi:hypothetical protein
MKMVEARQNMGGKKTWEHHNQMDGGREWFFNAAGKTRFP